MESFVVSNSSVEGGGALDWPVQNPLGRALDQLQDDLLCPICQSFFTNPQMLLCGHSFCSLCIRKHCDAVYNRTSHNQCPCCREKANLSDLRKNVSLASVVAKFRSLGQDLLFLLENKPSADNGPAEQSEGSLGKKKVRLVTPGKAITTRLAHYNFHGASKEAVRQAIEGVTKESKVRLRTDGPKEALERRLRELIHLINAQLGDDQPLTLEEAVEAVNEQERASGVEGVKAKGKGKGVDEEGFRELTKRALQARREKAPPSSSQSQAAPSPWRVAFSAKLKRPFYFNVVTNIGQFTRPEDFQPLSSPDTLASAGEAFGGRDGESDAEQQQESPVSRHEKSDDSTQPNPSEHGTSSFPLNQEGSVEIDSSPAVALEESPIIPSPILPTAEPLSSSLGDAAPLSRAGRAGQEGQRGQWVCEACTYINSQPRAPHCEMCETPNPAHFSVYSKPSRSQKGPQNGYSERSLIKASLSSQPSLGSQRKKQRK